MAHDFGREKWSHSWRALETQESPTDASLGHVNAAYPTRMDDIRRDGRSFQLPPMTTRRETAGSNLADNSNQAWRHRPISPTGAQPTSPDYHPGPGHYRKFSFRGPEGNDAGSQEQCAGRLSRSQPRMVYQALTD